MLARTKEKKIKQSTEAKSFDLKTNRDFQPKKYIDNDYDFRFILQNVMLSNFQFIN